MNIIETIIKDKIDVLKNDESLKNSLCLHLDAYIQILSISEVTNKSLIHDIEILLQDSMRKNLNNKTH